MCLFSTPEAPPTPAPPPPPAPAAAPLDLKMNKSDSTVSDTARRNRGGKRRFRVDKGSDPTQVTSSQAGMGGSGLQISKV